VPFRVNGQNRPAVLEENRRRMAEILTGFAVDDGLAGGLGGQINQRDSVSSRDRSLGRSQKSENRQKRSKDAISPFSL
jgi:hypothetical protein